jgi:hypothetical protein
VFLVFLRLLDDSMCGEFHCIACRDAYRLDELPTLCLHWKTPFLSPAPRSIFEVGTLGEGKSW